MDKYCYFDAAHIYWKIIPDKVLRHVQDCPIEELSEYDAGKLVEAANTIRMRLEEKEKKPMGNFDIQITYFKGTGKNYTSKNFSGLFETLKHDLKSIYMGAVIDWIKDLRKKGELPGLARGSHWPDGYIVVDCEDSGYPCLILPEEIS